MNGEGIVTFGCHAHLNKVVAAAHGADAVVEHVLLLVNTLQHSGDAALRHVHRTHHLRPLLASLPQTQLQMFVKVGNRIDRFLLNGHAEPHVLTNLFLYHRVVLRTNGLVRDGRRYRAAYVTAHVVGVHMVRKRHRKSHHYILTGMHVGHNPDFRAVEHRVIKEVIHH